MPCGGLEGHLVGQPNARPEATVLLALLELVAGGEPGCSSLSWHVPQAAAQLLLHCPALALLTPSFLPQLEGISHALRIKPHFQLGIQAPQGLLLASGPPRHQLHWVPANSWNSPSTIILRALILPSAGILSFLCPLKGSLSMTHLAGAPQGACAEAASGSGAWGPVFLMLTDVPSLDPG